MMMKPALLLAGLFNLLPSILAWGVTGHEAVGYVAMQFLNSDTLTIVEDMLAANFSGSLGVAGPWADTVRPEAAFAWSAPLHFVDAEDSPLQGQCSVDEKRDCGDNICILGAIANYTVRVVDTSLSKEQRLEALAFLDHFLGDIGQPLHVEAISVGGNDIDATCSGKSTNLHSVWDSGILDKNVDSVHGGTSQSYANDLVAEIKTGKFKSLTSQWTACSSTTEPASDAKAETSNRLHSDDAAAITPLACPLVWARESNAFDCTAVFNFTTGEDLCTGTYFDNVVPIIDLQIAKQGYRLGMWLNELFS